MIKNANGFNMLDVKKKNRNAILELIYRSNGISRKEIAARLGLTPAAITLITTDLINEGLLREAATEASNGRKGRKEITLVLQKERYAVIGVYISKQKFHFACMDLSYHTLFEDTVYTADCHGKSSMVLNKVASILSSCLTNYDVLRTRTLLGIGVCTHGIVNSREGISVNSFGVFERQVNISEYLEAKLHVPVFLTNNICALAHGELSLSVNKHPQNMLFIKYGPGVGAARTNASASHSVFDYKAVELGHFIIDPNGAPCICGNQGCLETIVSYDAIEHSIRELITEASSPVLYRLTEGNPENLRMKHIMQAYEEKEALAETVMRRTVHYLVFSIRNALQLLDPEIVILYGELFENASLSALLYQELLGFHIAEKVQLSQYNLQLSAIGPASTMIHYFFENGALSEE